VTKRGIHRERDAARNASAVAPAGLQRGVLLAMAVGLAGCGRVTDSRAGNEPGDANAADAPAHSVGFPAGAVATWGYADEAGTAPSELVVYADGVAPDAAPITWLASPDYCRDLAFGPDRRLFVACDPPAPRPPHLIVWDDPRAPAADVDISSVFSGYLGGLAVGPDGALYLLRRGAAPDSATEVAPAIIVLRQREVRATSSFASSRVSSRRSVIPLRLLWTPRATSWSPIRVRACSCNFPPTPRKTQVPISKCPSSRARPASRSPRRAPSCRRQR
jgi:hypothetical protein